MNGTPLVKYCHTYWYLWYDAYLHWLWFSWL